MRVCLVTPFYNENENISRPSFVRGALIKRGFYVHLVTSDFSHSGKKRVSFSSECIHVVRTLPYRSNTSPIRFISHFFLSIALFLKAYSFRKEVDCFYVTSPFVVTAFLLKIFSKSKVVVDIVDYWPNSLPFPKKRWNKSILSVWSALNHYFYSYVDRIISLSSNFLRLVDGGDDDLILLGASKKWNLRKERNDALNILYLGNIGSLYDFESLLMAIKKYNGVIKLHVIGDGDRREFLLGELNSSEIDYIYHGEVYDEEVLKKIMEICDLGFNGYVNTNASFSYKSISYFSYGLPIVNSMDGDLYDFVEKYKIGANYKGGDYNSLIEALQRFELMDRSEVFNNVKDFFECYLDRNIIESKLEKVFHEVVYEKNI